MGKNGVYRVSLTGDAPPSGRRHRPPALHQRATTPSLSSPTRDRDSRPPPHPPLEMQQRSWTACKSGKSQSRFYNLKPAAPRVAKPQPSPPRTPRPPPCRLDWFHSLHKDVYGPPHISVLGALCFYILLFSLVDIFSPAKAMECVLVDARGAHHI